MFGRSTQRRYDHIPAILKYRYLPAMHHYVRVFVGCLLQILTAAAAAAGTHQWHDEEVVSRRIFDQSPAAACYLFVS